MQDPRPDDPPQRPLYNLFSSSGHSAQFFGRALKLQHLRILAALAELKLVSKVAEALSVTQPAVSKQLTEIERLLDLPIVVRERNRLFFTPAGERLAQHAQAVLEQLKRAELEIDAMRFGMTGNVKIGTASSLTPVYLPRAIATLKTGAPNTAVSVIEGHFRELLPKLSSGAIDVAIVRSWHVQEIPGVSQKALMTEPICVVVHPSHPLAGREHLSWDEAMDWPWVLPEAGSIARQEIDAFFARKGARVPRNTIASLSLQLNLALAREMPTLMLFPDMLARVHAARGDLVPLPLHLDGFLSETRCFWRSGDEETNSSLALFLRCLEQTAQSGVRNRP